MKNKNSIYYENDLKFEVEELDKNLFYIKISDSENNFVVYFNTFWNENADGKINQIKIDNIFFSKSDNEIKKDGRGQAKKETYLKADILLKKISKAFDNSTAHNKKFANISSLQIAFISRYGLIGKL